MGIDWGALCLGAHAELFGYLATAGVAESRREDGIVVVATGVRSNTYNGVVSGRLDGVDDRTIGELIAWFDARSLPASWLCIEAVDLRDRLIPHGCQPEESGEDMGIRLDGLPAARATPPAGVVISPVRTREDLEGWLDVAAACGWFDRPEQRDALRRLYLSLGLEADRPQRHYLARRAGLAVGMASAFFGRRTMLLESLAVVEHERRRGIGRALALTRLVEARAAGYETAVLEPTPDGWALYRALGFETSPTPAGRWFYLPLGLSGSQNSTT